MANDDDDLLARLGSAAREREHEADRELLHPSLQLRDADALREAIVAQALTRQLTQKRAQKHVGLSLSRARVWWASGIAAAAAALIIWIVRPAAETLPQYSLIHRGSLERERGVPASDLLELRPSSRLELELKPRSDVPGPVQLHLFARRADTLSQLTPDALERSASGGFRASLLAGRHFGAAPGKLTILAIVCRPESCEQAQNALGGPAASDTDTWQVLSIDAVYKE